MAIRRISLQDPLMIWKHRDPISIKAMYVAQYNMLDGQGVFRSHPNHQAPKWVLAFYAVSETARLYGIPTKEWRWR